MSALKKILITYHEFPPIAYDLADAFQRLGIETELFITSHHEHWFYKHIIKRVNKLARNCRLIKKGQDLFANYPLNHLNYLASQYQLLAESFQPDVVLVIHGQPFGNAYFEQFRLPKVAWWIEPDESLATLLKYSAPFDLYLSFSDRVRNLLEAEGVATASLNHAVDLGRFYSIPSVTKRYDVVFVGNWSPWRDEVLNQLLTVTQNVALVGPYWQKKSRLSKAQLDRIYKGKSIVGAELNQLFNSAKIVLNAQRIKDSSGLNMRFFEVLATNTCFLTDAISEIDNCFVREEHLCVYHTLEELGQQVEKLLTYPLLREQISMNGYQQVRQNYTYEHMASNLLAYFAQLR
jgi:glycosyltransferase involved in cell wall biosynthesis